MGKLYHLTMFPPILDVNQDDNTTKNKESFLNCNMGWLKSVIF